MKKYQLVKFEDGNFTLDVRADTENETVWLTQDEMAVLFDSDRTRITRHIGNIIKDGELDEKSNVRKAHFTHSDKPVKLYNLDMIISVGYRLRSQRGIVFRRWANGVLKQYLIQGYALNNKRLEVLNKVVDIQNRMLSYALDIDKEELLKVIVGYTRALDLLDSYDHQTLLKPKGSPSSYVITYKEAREIIDSLKFKESSDLFGVEKQKGKLEGIISQIYQNVFVRNYIQPSKRKLLIYSIS